MISHSKHCSRQRQRKNWLRCILHTYSVLSFHYTLRCKITALREMIRLCWSCKTENAELSTLHERGHIEYIHTSQQVGIGSCINNVQPSYVSDRDIGNTDQDRNRCKSSSDAPFTHINFFPSITPCVARLPLCMKWTWLALLSPSGDLGISLVWHNLSPPHPTGPHRHFSVRLLK